MNRFFHRLILCLGSLAFIWIVGLGLFAAEIRRFAALPPPTEKADAIVVLTGGSERLRTGATLLAEGQAKAMLISGVHKNTNLSDLADDLGLSDALKKCCVALGKEADSTLGNAHETAAWLSGKNDQSIFLVTAHYHMPRSLLLFRYTLPHMMIIPVAAEPKDFPLIGWWKTTAGPRILISEYHKYIGALMYLSGQRLFGATPDF
jgi:uncharacterized SAM-binding protein YcdF (DUF218 family)